MWYYGKYQLGITAAENNKASHQGVKWTCNAISILGDEEPSFSIKLALPGHWWMGSARSLKERNPLASHDSKVDS